MANGLMKDTLAIAKFCSKVEDVLEKQHSIVCTDEERETIRDCWRDRWDTQYTVKLIVSYRKGCKAVE